MVSSFFFQDMKSLNIAFNGLAMRGGGREREKEGGEMEVRM